MEELKQKLVDIINESTLPAEAVWFVVKDFYRDIDEAYQKYKMQQADALAAENKEEE